MIKNKNQKYYLFLIKTVVFSITLLSIFTFIFTPKATAYIVINEVYPNPTSGENEWIELYNVNTGQTSPQSLNNWEIWDKLSSPNVIYSFTTQSLSPGEYLVIPISSKLNNSGDGVTLKDSNSSIIDDMSYSSSTTSESISRIPNATGGFTTSSPSTPGIINQDNTSPTPQPSTTQPTPTDSPSPTSYPTITSTPTVISTQSPTPSTPSGESLARDGTILLSEIMACPESGSEWVEIYNLEDYDINLENWTIWDSQGKIFTFTTKIISSSGYISIDITQKLNNTGDTVTLVGSDNATKSSFSYSNCIKGENYILSGDEWYSTTISTKNSPNISTNTNDIQEDSEASSGASLSDSSDETADSNSSDSVWGNTNIDVSNNNTQASGYTSTMINNPDSTVQKLTAVEIEKTLSDQYNSLKNITLTTVDTNITQDYLPDNLKNTRAHLSFLPSRQSKTAIISVLLGGTIMILLGGYNLVEYYITYAENKTIS